KIKNDKFLCEYNLQGNLFTKTFILENQEKWEKNANRFEFNKVIAFKETVEETNKIISRIRK
ncbi:MAG: hypothetical protein PHY26_00940, partial [Bacilli bacterium]|nr:hypothetical protein [Bacilli bacterium]